MRKVLVVEDNPHNRKLVQLVLEKGGFTVLVASDGETGLRMAIEEQPEAIVMDVQMPGRDGLSVTRDLKADPRTASIKVLALTALAMKGDEDRIMAAGCDAYVAKPFHYATLLASLQRLLA